MGRFLVIAGLLAAALWWGWKTGRVEALTAFDPLNAVQLGVVYEKADIDDLMVKGVALAVNEINAAGGLSGRPVVLRPRAEPQAIGDIKPENVVRGAIAAARRLAEHPNLIAVIGHGGSQTAIAASAVYERHGKLFLATSATNLALTSHRFERVFGLLPNDRLNAQVLARHTVDMGLKRLIILSDDSDYGRQTSTMFAQYVEADGATIVFRETLDIKGRSPEQTLLPLLDNDTFSMADIDGFLVIAQPHDAGRLIRSIRQLGIDLPILGADAMDTPECEATAGAAAMKDVYALTVYHPSALQEPGHRFREAFRTAYGVEPTPWAALGYDAVRLVAEGAQRAQSLEPARIADALRVMRYVSPYVGATGPFFFNRRGEAVGKFVSVVRHDGERFELVRTFQTGMAEIALNAPDEPALHTPASVPTEPAPLSGRIR